MSFALVRSLLLSAFCVEIFACCCNVEYEEIACSNTLDKLPNFMTYMNKTYYLYNSKKVNWHEANIICKEHGMDLLTISNDQEFEAVRNFFTKKLQKSDGLWTSGTDLGIEGDWRWMSNGKKVVTKNFHNKQPDNHNGLEHCLHFSHNYEWKFNDIQCSEKYYFMCEMQRMCLINY